MRCCFEKTPCKINMEHNNRCVEDDFPLQSGAILSSMLIVRFHLFSTEETKVQMQ